MEALGATYYSASSVLGRGGLDVRLASSNPGIRASGVNQEGIYQCWIIVSDHTSTILLVFTFSRRTSNPDLSRVDQHTVVGPN